MVIFSVITGFCHDLIIFLILDRMEQPLFKSLVHDYPDFGRTAGWSADGSWLFKGADVCTHGLAMIFALQRFLGGNKRLSLSQVSFPYTVMFPVRIC
jgi:hypothetical protein